MGAARTDYSTVQKCNWRNTAKRLPKRKIRCTFKFLSGKMLLNFKLALGNSFYLEHHLEDPRVCTKCSLILFIWNSAWVKTCKLGQVHFRPVYAMFKLMKHRYDITFYINYICIASSCQGMSRSSYSSNTKKPWNTHKETPDDRLMFP